MLRLGTAGLWLLLLCGPACGDRVIVARGLSLVSAAQSSEDGGIWEPEQEDAGPDAADGSAAKPAFDAEHGSPGRRPPPPRAAGHGDPHDKDAKTDGDETNDTPLAGDAGLGEGYLKGH